MTIRITGEAKVIREDNALQLLIVKSKPGRHPFRRQENKGLNVFKEVHHKTVKHPLLKGSKEVHRKIVSLLRKADRAQKAGGILLQDKKMAGLVRTDHPEVIKIKRLSQK